MGTSKTIALCVEKSPLIWESMPSQITGKSEMWAEPRPPCWTPFLLSALLMAEFVGDSSELAKDLFGRSGTRWRLEWSAARWGLGSPRPLSSLCRPLYSGKYNLTRKFSPPTGGFFLAPAEGWRALRAQRWFSRTKGQTDNGFKVVRYKSVCTY